LAVDDSLLNITYSQNTIGNGSKCTWNGTDDNGDLQTLDVKENATIFQTMNFNGNSADVTMSFKDTIGGTKITWKAKGEMGFLYKVLTAFNGGAGKILGIQFEKSLVNLDKKLDYEINTFSIKENGLVNKPETFYLAQTFTSEFSKIKKNSEIVFSKINKFCRDNNIKLNGKPFIIYHTYDEIKELTKVSMCIPIKDSIFISEGSDISSEKLKTFQAIKATLTGDYTHISKAIAKTKEYINTNHLNTNPNFSHIEVYALGKKEINSPSKWVTELYFPIAAKIVTRPAYRPLSDSVAVKAISTLKAEPSVNTATSEKVIPAVKIKPTLKTEPSTKAKKEIPSEF
jgi:effector-binding domain-containing protein